MSKATTCPKCGKQSSMAFRYRRFMRSRLGSVVIRCRLCGYNKNEAEEAVNQKVHTAGSFTL